jgi:hypothetical protein
VAIVEIQHRVRRAAAGRDGPRSGGSDYVLAKCGRFSFSAPMLRPALRRRSLVRTVGFLLMLRLALCAACPFLNAASGLRVSTFSADVTVPIGHPMMGGLWVSKNISDPLEAHGLVLFSAEKPIVVVAIDWCEIRNDAYFRWQEVLASAAQTTPERVMISTVHQHDAPVADLEAERILRERKLKGSICTLDFHETAVQRVADAVRRSLPTARPITHLGMGSAQVLKVASNRRYLTPQGSVRFDRGSRTVDKISIQADEGLTDPFLKTLSFWNNETPLVAISAYATHPMSHYGKGEVSADFPGIARRMRQKETPGVAQLYLTGAGGNITAGKYNDGAAENRAVLAKRIHTALTEAWQKTIKTPITNLQFRSQPVHLQPRESSGFTIPDLEKKLTPEAAPFDQCRAAMGWSWQKRFNSGRPIAIPCIDLGVAQWLLLPGESYVEFQLAAQQMSPDKFVLVGGYGDGATGYIPTKRHVEENDSNLSDWCWVAPGSDTNLLAAIRNVLAAPESEGAAAPWRTNLPIALVKKEIYLEHKAPQVAPWVSLQYVGPQMQLREVQGIERESDVGEEIKARWSADNGLTWSDFVPVQPSNKTNYNGVSVWEGECAGVYHDVSGLLVQLWLRQIELKGIYHNFTYIRTSKDQGRIWTEPKQLRYETGNTFDIAQPLKPGFLHRNEGYPGNNIFVRPNGTLVLCLAHANALSDPKNDSRPWRLGSVCFSGKWDPAKRDYLWEPAARVEISQDISARGLMEPEVAELKDGRLLIVWRGSTTGWDGTTAKLPGRKLFSLSTNGARTLSPPAEWKYDDGSSFYSPSSFHRMIRHQKTDKLYWLGNISSTPPSGNSPRYPLVIAEVNEQKAALNRSTVTAIDDRKLGQGDIQFSNFPLIEDRMTHDLILYMTTFGQEQDPKHWATADNYRYTLVLRELR